MLPHLHGVAEIKEIFSRMDHNGDGAVDLTDFLMWEERMQEGRGNTDFFALQEVSTKASGLTKYTSIMFSATISFPARRFRCPYLGRA